VSREILNTQRERVLLRRRDGSEISLESPLLGRPNVLALAAGISAAELLTDQRLEAPQIERALLGAGERGRSTIVELPGGVIVVDDTYNASPASVEACIETGREMSRVSGGRLWLVLGEMLELGSLSRDAHEDMGRLARASGAAGAAFIQGDAKIAFSVVEGGLSWSAFFASSDEVAVQLAPRIAPADVVVVKASRGVRAERVVEGLAERLAPARGQLHLPENSPQENGGPRT
jgi:UDP-N-acetylmuramoyl-tripeptide--D-alanyl-D-alanine ligase